MAVGVAFLALAAFPCHARAGCASNLEALRALLRDEALPLQWRETGMDDARPLHLTLSEREGVLFIRFVKAAEGMWAEGEVTVCGQGGDGSLRLDAQHMRAGEASPWILRAGLARMPDLMLRMEKGRHLHVATRGWKGRFEAAP